MLHVDKRRRRRRANVRAALAAAGVLAALGAVVAVTVALREPQPLLADGQGPEAEWDLAFRDEFSADALDRDIWTDHEPWEAGGYAISDGWHPVPAGPQQVEVSDGVLTLKARRGHSLPEGQPFTTAHINTRGTFSIPEGATSYTEARLRAPSAAGLLPAFWLLGNGDNSTGEGWPITGEIDILEFSNNGKDEGRRPFFSVWYPKDVYSDPPGTFLNGTHNTHPDSFDLRPELQDSWHTWGLYRSPERMDLYIDGVKQFTFRPGETYNEGLPLPEMLFREDMHLRLSLGVGGDWAGAGLEEDDYEEGDLAVDHVRVWLADE